MIPKRDNVINTIISGNIFFIRSALLEVDKNKTGLLEERIKIEIKILLTIIYKQAPKRQVVKFLFKISESYIRECFRLKAVDF